MEISTLSIAIGSLRSALGLLKDAHDLMIDSPKNRAAEVALATAEQQLSLGASLAAQEMGYNLCKCTFPPQIALLQEGAHKCPKCGRDTDEDYAPTMITGGY
jgi:hypothetical protein